MEIDVVEDASELIENEWYIVRYSGETPEIAYNSAIYHLSRATDGPQVTLTTMHIGRLKKAAVDRYEEIILRDLFHENVGKSIYRGVARSICNYGRFIQFCSRQDLTPEKIKVNAADVFSKFLQIEFQRLSNKDYETVINCSYDDLRGFAKTLETSFLPEYSVFEPFCSVE